MTTIVPFPATTWPNKSDTEAAVATAASISRRWGVTIEPGERSASIFIGPQSGGNGVANDAYALSRDPETRRIEVVDLEDPCDLVGTFGTVEAALAFVKHADRPR